MPLTLPRIWQNIFKTALILLLSLSQLVVYYFQATFYISYIWRPWWILWGQRLQIHKMSHLKLIFLMSPIMCNIQCLHPLFFMFAMWINDLLRLDTDTIDWRPEVLEFYHTCVKKCSNFIWGILYSPCIASLPAQSMFVIRRSFIWVILLMAVRLSVVKRVAINFMVSWYQYCCPLAT